MAIPKYKYVRYGFLKYAGDEQEHHVQETTDALANYFDLSDEERQELLNNGRNYKFRYMTSWAKTYLTKARLIESTGRGTYHITERGLNFLSSLGKEEITKPDLMKFPEFVIFATPSSKVDDEADISEGEIDQSPKDIIDNAYEQLYKTLADDLIETILSVSPLFFERLVIDLLLAMGYGSSLDSGKHLGQSNDGGIDGLIREDKLGLDTIYIQAKRYSSERGIGRPDIQGFVGSLIGVGASKGVFITTSYFTNTAIEYALNVNNLKVILIDGQQLATLMIEHNVGISVQEVYEIKQIDENYFPDV